MIDTRATERPNVQMFSCRGKRVWVAGDRGMVGSAMARRLRLEECELLTVSRQDVDLRRQSDVERWVSQSKPEVVVLAAAKVGGILANDSMPAEFLYDNLMIEANIIAASRDVGVQKLLFLGSSCIYPKFAPQPIPEESLLGGPLEPTNEWYAVAKIAGIKLCQSFRRQYGCDFISAMPTNLYGPGDNFDLATSHVLPALVRKIHEAKSRNAEAVEIWGSGTPLREFLHVDDLADACVFLLEHYSEAQHVNVGTGHDISIRDLASLIAEVIDYQGRFLFDTSKPDGTPRKLLDITKLRALGWSARIELKAGILHAYRWYLENKAAADSRSR